MDTMRKKKTPRVRNRPRNKTNQSKIDENNQVDLEVIHDNNDDNNKERPISSEDIRIIQQALRHRILQKQQKEAQEQSLAEALSRSQILQTEGLSEDLIVQFQKKIDHVMKKDNNLPEALLNGLQMIMQQQQQPQQLDISDGESSSLHDDDYIEYVYQPRPYFLTSLCHFCKSDLRQGSKAPCHRCGLIYYCTPEHMKMDWQQHRTYCYALQQVSQNNGGQIFRKCGEFSAEQFRCYRIVMMRQVESIIHRNLSADEQEVLLFPRVCNEPTCRENSFAKLLDCNGCGQVSYCRKNPHHLNENHNRYCSDYSLFQKLVVFNHKFGRLDPEMPTKVLACLPEKCRNTQQILNKLALNTNDECEFAVLSQLATVPLTAWFALKLCGQWQTSTQSITIHLIGAEIDFEVNALNKWELFLLHLTPTLKELNVVFVGPELKKPGIDFQLLAKIKCCQNCRSKARTVNYYFESQLYHDYYGKPNYMPPHLICFFNAGLHRTTGFQLDDTWPETIMCASQASCPIVVTAYTQFEAPLDMMRLLQESSHPLNVVLPPTVNPFKSTKPERNFISDHEVPIMFKNYFCFIVE